MNHYWCYEANGPRVGVRATLEDQFSGPDNVRITTPTLLCNPAEKVHGDERFRIEDRNLHLACYEVHGKQRPSSPPSAPRTSSRLTSSRSQRGRFSARRLRRRCLSA
jgi:hypothetical protein